MAVAHSVSSSVEGNSVTSLTVASFAVSGSNTMLISGCGNGGPAAAVSSVVFNTSESFTEVADTGAFGTVWRHFMHRLVAPTATTASIVGTYAASAEDAALGVGLYTGVDQTTPLDTPDNATGTTANPERTVSSAVDDVVFQTVFTEDPTIAVRGGGTSRWEHDGIGGGSSAGGSDEAGAASVTLGWTIGTGLNWGILTVNINQVSAGGAYNAVPTIMQNYRNMGYM